MVKCGVSLAKFNDPNFRGFFEMWIENGYGINLPHESKAREIVHEIHKDLKDKIISDLSNARSIHIIVDESPDARRQSMIHIMVRYILYTI